MKKIKLFEEWINEGKNKIEALLELIYTNEIENVSLAVQIAEGQGIDLAKELRDLLLIKTDYPIDKIPIKKDKTKFNPQLGDSLYKKVDVFWSHAEQFQRSIFDLRFMVSFEYRFYPEKEKYIDYSSMVINPVNILKAWGDFDWNKFSKSDLYNGKYKAKYTKKVGTKADMKNNQKKMIKLWNDWINKEAYPYFKETIKKLK